MFIYAALLIFSYPALLASERQHTNQVAENPALASRTGSSHRGHPCSTKYRFKI